MPATPRLPRQQGAALLLMIMMVLGAAALLISAFEHVTGEAARERLTLQRLSQAREALIGYAVLHGRLPRPAVSALLGQESPTPCQTEMDCTGILPWVTLGVDGADSWGKLLRYSVTPAFTRTGIDSSTTVATKQVMGRDASGATYFEAGNAACSAASPCAPAVVFSSGKHNLGTSTLGVALANAAWSNPDELNNNSATTPFFNYAAQQDPARTGGEFDDLLVWVPLPTLYQRMFKSGTLRTRNLYGGMPDG